MNRSRFAAGVIAAVAITAVTAAGPAEGRGLYGRSRPNDATPCQGARQDALDLIGLTGDGRLVCFREDRPGRARDLGRIRGLARDDVLVGIDHRAPFTDANGVANGVPAGGTLYGLGRKGGIYSIDVGTVTATRKAQMDKPLDGTFFGIDFNPTVDRLRVVSEATQNLRINVDTGATIVDAPLRDETGAPGAGITAIAYTNNDTDPATATTLYDIDTAFNQLSIQNPPNSGMLNPVGALTVDVDTRAGFDLYSVNVTSGAVQSTVDVRGFAVLVVAGRPALYRIAPFSGRAVAVGPVDRNVVDVAIPLAQ